MTINVFRGLSHHILKKAKRIYNMGIIFLLPDKLQIVYRVMTVLVWGITSI